MKVEIKNINNVLNKQQELSGFKKYYQISYNQQEDCYIWDRNFIETLDKYLFSEIKLNKSELRQIEEFLDHEDMAMIKEQIGHDAEIQESLDFLFLQTTLQMIKEIK